MEFISKLGTSIFIGNEAAAMNKALLQHYGVTHILIAAQELAPHFPEDFQYCHLAIRDRSSEKLLQFVGPAIDFINQALASGGTVYIHCYQGISRSPAIAIAYIMHSTRLKFKEAFAFVQARHVDTSPNSDFVKALQTFNVGPAQCSSAKTVCCVIV